MDKYEYKLKVDQLKNLIQEGDYSTAGQIVDSINWKKVRNSATLCMVGDVYDHLGRYNESKEIYLLAYDHAPIGRSIVYKLTEVAIKANSVAEAEEYYNEFTEIAGNDTKKYILRYKLSSLKNEPIQNRISILEELKEREYTEAWAYELACLYQEAGKVRECVDLCDELDLWFGEGEYVEKALELKMNFEPLTKSQEEKYRQFHQKRQEVIASVPEKEDTKENVADYLTNAAVNEEELELPPLDMPVVAASVAEGANLKPEQPKYSTLNLQDELRKSMQQILDAKEKDQVAETMDSIMKMVDDIPQLKKESSEPVEGKLNEDILNEKIDESLNADFQEFLEEETEGELSMEVPTSPLVEKQITGQLSIEDVLADWEKTKRAAEAAMAVAEQKKLEVAKRKAIQDAQELIKKLEELSPELQDGTTPKELMAQEILAGGQEEEPVAELQEESAALTQEEHVAEVQEESVAELQEEPVSDTQVMPDLTAARMLSEFAESAEPTEEPVEKEKTLEELLAETDAENEMQKEPVEEAEEDALQDVLDDAHKILLEEIEKIAKATAGIDEILNGTANNASASEEEQDVSQEIPTDADVEAQMVMPDVTGMMEQEAMQEETAETVETGNAVVDEVPLPADLMEDIVSVQGNVDKVVLTKEQRALFPYFLPVPGMEEQICQILKECLNRKKTITSLTGNIIIQGPDGSGKTVLAASLIKALQMMTSDADGRTGKISAAALNKKDFTTLIPKLQGGYLIIEKAGNLSSEAMERISKAMEGNTQGLVVIMEDSMSRMNAMLKKNHGFSSKFTSQITIPVFTIDELVDFGKSYAREMECSIDEMGILALYNRISNIQKHDKATTLTEVREIVDQAIESAESGGGLKKTFGSFFSKRYNENDCLILHEKDFDV